MSRRCALMTMCLALNVGCYAQTTYVTFDLGGSSLTTSSSWALADGQSAVTITLVAKTRAGLPIENLQATFSCDLCTFTQPAGPTNSQGVTVAQVRSTVVGLRSIVVNVAYADYRGTLPFGTRVAFLARSPTVNYPTTAQAGVAVDLGVTATQGAGDANVTIDATYAGTAHFVCTDANAVLPADYTFAPADLGEHTFPVGLTLFKAGNQTVSMIDTQTGQVLWQDTIAVSPGPVARLVLSSEDATVVSGAATELVITAFDLYGNLQPSYSDTVTVSSTDPSASFATPVVFTVANAGTQSLGGALSTAGLQQVSIVDSHGHYANLNLTVSADLLHPRLHLSGLTTVMAGTASTAMLAVTDPAGNPLVNYQGAVTFTSSDPQASLPSLAVFTAQSQGHLVLTGAVTLRTAGLQSVTVADALDATDNATQAMLLVTAGPATQLGISGVVGSAAGTPCDVSLQALDAFGNIDTGFVGSVHLGSSDANAVWSPQTVAFTSTDSGSKTLAGAVTLRTAGMQTVTATSGSLLGSIGPVLITHATASALAFAGPVHANACQTIPSVAVTIVDAYGNVVPSNAAVSLSVAALPTGITLQGTLTQAAVSGQALFNDLVLSAPLAATPLHASATGLTAVDTSLTVQTAPPTISAVTAPSSTASCIPISYTVTQSCGTPVDVYVGFHEPSDANDRTASQAPSLTVPGVLALHANQAGVPYTYLWDASRDLPRRNTQATVDIYAVAQGVRGPTASVTNVAVANGLAFGSAQVSEAGRQVVAMDLGDFNHDGKLDAVVVDAAAAVSVDLGDGNGLLVAGTPTTVTGAQAVAAGNTDLDGNLDVAVGSASGLYLLRGLGNGNLAAPVQKASGFAITTLAAADIDHDGKSDWVFSDGVSTLGWVLSGSSYNALSQLPLAGVVALALGDVNRDGWVDLVVTSSANTTVLWGSVTGFTAPGKVYSVPGTQVSLADVNHDAVLDTLVSQAAGVQILLGNPNGALSVGPLLPTPSPDGPVGVADLDADGRADIVGAAVGAGRVDIWLGSAAGFVAATPLTAQATPVAMRLGEITGNGRTSVVLGTQSGLDTLPNQRLAPCTWGMVAGERFNGGAGSTEFIDFGDFNEDGKTDVVLEGGATSNTLQLFLGDGAGGLVASNTFPADNSLGFPRVADLNGDGHADVVIGNGIAAHLRTYLGDGNANFPNTATVPLSDIPVDVRLADVNRDGFTDVVAGGDHYLQALLNDGNGNLTPMPALTTVAGTGGLDVGDVDGDGNPDAAVFNGTTNNLAVYLGDGAGAFVPQSFVLPLPSNPKTMRLADFDRDGHLDAALSCISSAPVLYLVYGDGTGHFPRSTYVPSSLVANVLETADINGDGYPDLLDGIGAFDHVEVRINDGFGNFNLSNSGLYVDGGPIHVRATDMTGDHLPDIVVTSATNAMTVIPLASGTVFMAPIFFETEGAPAALSAADVNRDGHTDIVQVLHGDATLTTFLGLGDGRLQKQLGTAAVGTAPVAFVMADFNADGAPDAVTVNQGANTLSVSLNDPSTGTLLSGTPFNTGTSPADVVAADVDNNGTVDAVVINAGSATVTVHLNPGNGTFAASPSRSIGVGTNPVSLAAADLNHDGYIDLAVVDHTAAVWTLMGSASGFAAANNVLSLQGGAPAKVLLGDLDRDGTPDVVVLTYPSPDVQWAMGKGDGSFKPLQTFSFGNIVPFGRLADINQDGNLDVVVSKQTPGGLFSNSIAVLLGDGHGNFPTFRAFPATQTPNGSVVGDLNEDGLTDVVTLGTTAPMVLELGR